MPVAVVDVPDCGLPHGSVSLISRAHSDPHMVTVNLRNGNSLSEEKAGVPSWPSLLQNTPERTEPGDDSQAVMKPEAVHWAHSVPSEHNVCPQKTFLTFK